MSTADEPDIEGSIIIEWPAAHGNAFTPLPGWGISIYDTLTGKQITTAWDMDIVIHADASRCVTASLTLLTDEAGNPVFDGNIVHMKDGEIAMDVFTFLVTEMRIKK